MRSAARLWLIVVPAALVVGGGALALSLTSDHESGPAVLLVLAMLIGWAFVAAGLVARTRRPDNRTGLLLIAVGLTWFVSGLSGANDSYVWTVGFALSALWAALFVHVLLAYPSGRLEAAWQRAVVIGGYLLAGLAEIAIALFDPDPASCKDCPTNELLVSDNHTAAVVALTIVQVLAAVYLISVAVAVALRWRGATAVARRLLGPVLLAGLTSVALLGISIGLEPVSESASEVVSVVAALAFLAVPFLFLSGLLRGRLARTGVGRTLIRLPDQATPTEAQAVLRKSLRDPRAELVFWHPDHARYVDVEGKPRDPARPGPRRAATLVEAEGEPIGAILHDEALLDERELLDEASDAARLAIAKDRARFELETSERRSRALLEAIPDNIYRVAREGARFLDFSGSDTSRIQLPPEGIVGATIHDLGLPPEFVERSLAAVETAFETGEVQELESELVAGGDRRHVETRVVPSGEDEYYVIVRDVTDRKRAEAAVELQRDFLSAMGDATPSLLAIVGLDGRMSEDPINHALREFTGLTVDQAAGAVFWEVVSAPEDAVEAEQVVREVTTTGKPASAETHWLARGGERRLVAWTCTPLPVADPGREFHLVSGVDVTERARQEKEQAALRRVAVAVASERRTEHVFDLVTEEVGRLLDAHSANVARFEPEGDAIVILGQWSEPGVFAQQVGSRIRLEGGPLNMVLDTGRPVRVDLNEDRIPQPLAGRLRDQGVSSVVAAPIVVSGKLWGAVTVSMNAPDTFAPGSEERIGEFTRLVSLALANEEAREQLAASRARIVEAGDAERRRLERNLHDGAQQRLVSLSLSLRLAQAKLAKDPHAADELLSGASVELALALEELRELARGIHPAVLTDRGLGPALESLADRAPVRVELECLPDERLPGPVEAAAFYVVSEALANVAKYADASTVRVSVERLNGRAVVEVADDGKGGADPTRGSGLRGLVDRVEALDGQLAVESPAGAGTRVRAEIPL